MNCCGQKRQQWQQQNTAPQPTPVVAEPVLQNPVPVVYKGSGSCLVKGEATGLLYLFGEQEPQLQVDERDIQQFLDQPGKFKNL